MKLSRILAEYLSEHKELALPGFGHFTLLPPTLPLPDDKKEHPIEEVHFRPDPKTALDESLIQFISARSGKMRPLAISDLESFLEIGRQLLNISKPFSIEGVGTLLSKSDRTIEFVRGEAVVHGDEGFPKRKHKAPEDHEVSFEENYLHPRRKSASSGQRLAVTGLVVLGICLIGWVAWFFYQQSLSENTGQVTNSSPTETDLPVQTASYQPGLKDNAPAADSTVIRQGQDSAIQGLQKEETSAVSIPATPGSFEVVLEVSRKNRALQRYADLKEWGHKVRMSTEDSLTFKLSIPIEAPLSDSIRHRDSLSRFFGRKVWIETH